MIKHLGETVSPQEIEEAIDQLRDLRYSAAIGIDHGGPEGEQIFVFMEIHSFEKFGQSGYHDLCVEAVETIYKRLGLRPARVYLLKPHSIPRTYNGKIQHNKLKQDYLSGSLRSSGEILYPEY